jgi:adenine-specific DNA methylase
MTDLTPLSLKDSAALIEAVFPAQKVSFEAQRERKAGSGQTLTSLGSYWKGRKPLILVRAIILGTLLPQTEDSEKDLEIFEKLLAFDDHGLARRALIQNELKPNRIAACISLANPWNFFTFSGLEERLTDPSIRDVELPFDAESQGITLRWRRDIGEDDKLCLIERALETYGSYEKKASLCKRPEELDQEWLYAPIWRDVNNHYSKWGVHAHSIQELVEQLGILRYGHRPNVGDTFSGGGSIPFEAARMGCKAYASDLNPVACMLTWGALEIIGAKPERRSEIDLFLDQIAARVDDEITSLGVEHDSYGNRAKAYLYCLETRCPETGWMVPLAPSWVISQGHNVVAELIPDYQRKQFEIKVHSNVSERRMKDAEKGTVQGGALVYELDGRTYRTPIRTIRGEFRDENGESQNKLRLWERNEFKARPDDILQERLYAVQWISKETLNLPRQHVYFESVSEEDHVREAKIERVLAENFDRWQLEGFAPDMAIETGKENEGPIRTNGWAYWHHMFTPRQLLTHILYAKYSVGHPECRLIAAKLLDYCNKSSQWRPRGDYPEQLFSGQSMKTMFTWGARSCFSLLETMRTRFSVSDFASHFELKNVQAKDISDVQDIFVTDPPYADAVHYHEITEFFIAWLRANPPAPADKWVWDSRRALAIQGAGDDFRRGMVDAYSAMTKHMPDNGMQCVMFTHQDTNVWSDMVGIFWAANLQVVAAWYIATETTSELKKGGYVQGTVILMLRKRPAGERTGFKQRILPAVRAEVERQIKSMMHLNDEVKDKLGEPVFNDSDLQMAGYAAALKVLTAYTQIGGEDVTNFALRPRQRGEMTVVDEIVQQAAEAANSLLVPEGLGAETWARLTGVERFFFRMMDMETTGAKKLDNYQNFAKAFRVEDYARIMGDVAANNARLKGVPEFASRDLTDSSEIGPTWLGQLIIGLQQLLAEVEPQVVIGQIQADLPEFMEARALLIDMLAFIERKAAQLQVRTAAEVLGARMKNLRALGQ